ncbi:glycoside hydrolase family 2 protein [Winogradskyella sp.]|uniref:beta-mannosidase n=1 Tax=Winogradskyella sp. TaxID=1883156 RepID=UPI002608A742|nr:glycoside hydrolase family 2 protein [Winogradskyella sp.]
MLYNIYSVTLSVVTEQSRSAVERSLLILVLICFSCQPKHDVPITIEINQDWQFKTVNDSVWYPATVPGNVFTDLLDNNLIEDPFIGDNEKKVQWVSGVDWEYKTTFHLDKEILERKHLELNFEGLDTYASVYLNDSLILKANNAFRAWDVDVKSLFKSENELRLVFEKTSKYEETEKEKLRYELPEGNRIFTRKAQFQYGWDWGPKLNTSGIWKPIKLVSWNDVRLKDINIKQLGIEKNKAELLIDFGVLNSEYTYEIYVNDSLNFEFKKPNPLIPTWIPLIIKDPKLWWPHNIGKPNLYNIKVLVKDGRRILDSISVKKGLRTIALITEKDSIGESFYFKVNDVPVYAKGANYIPQHSFQNKVTNAHYEKLLNDVVSSNMNMLRVWGGGIYENDIFYELCDEKGILVWQDFMFACAMYPGDSGFLENVQYEAEQQVKRLRNYASLALWCGNNENSEGWHRWGWQANRSNKEKDEIWNNYLKVFDSILPITVSKLTDTHYWESSPKYGRGNPKYKTEGDAHDWWIWHDAYPFEHLEESVPRFMSEFGFQSFPSYEAIRFINQNDALNITSEGFKNHQKHVRGFQLIEDYMQRDFPMPDMYTERSRSAEDYVYMSQLLQAHGIIKGIEAHRRAKPYNMGALYWQFNDCWPAVSWSSIDHFGNWKALQYKLKRAFNNILISSKVENDTLKTWIVNDGLDKIKDKLWVSIKDFKGKVLWKDLREVTVKANSSQAKYKIPLSDIDFPKNEIYLEVSFNSVEEHFFFVRPKELRLKNDAIKWQTNPTEDGFAIELFSEIFQKDVFLSTTNKGFFTNNFFNLPPNKTMTIYFKTESKTLEKLKVVSFNNFIR